MNFGDSVNCHRNFHRNFNSARAEMRALIAENPERVVVAHGEIARSGGAAYLRRAFAWLL